MYKFTLDTKLLLILGVAILLAAPVLSVLLYWFVPSSEYWQHLVDTLLFTYWYNSFVLSVGVAVGTFCLGVFSAWLVTMTNMPGRAFFRWALLLPMAIPAYILAYSYTGMLDYSGPIQSWLRDLMGWQSKRDYWFFEIRSMTGAVCMLSLVLYPYVYLMASNAFMSQSRALLDVSRSLGRGPLVSFFTLAIPLARPAIISALALVLMEVLADYGTVKYFGIQTFTLGIEKAWYGEGSVSSAAQLASIMLGFVVILLLVEWFSRRRAWYVNQDRRNATEQLFILSRPSKVLAFVACCIPVLFGFILPCVQLMYWSYLVWQPGIDASFYQLIFNTMYLSAAASLVIVVTAIALGYARRTSGSRWAGFFNQLVGFGYAFPGMLIALGVAELLGWVENRLLTSDELLLSGTLWALLYAYMVRFMTIGMHNINNGFKRITPQMDQAANSLGVSRWRLFWTMHLPLLKGSVLISFILVFVEVVKELPLTLFLRPLDYNTLSVRAFEMASDERLVHTGPSALAIVMVGMIPVIWLSYHLHKDKQLSE